MAGYSTDVSRYGYIWSKYRPVILKLMVDAHKGPQQYKLSNHEFQGVFPNEKGGHSFTLHVFNSRAVNDIKTSIVAKDLLKVLKESRKATELTGQSRFEFVMDKSFVLSVNRKYVIKVIDGDNPHLLRLPYSPTGTVS